VADDDVRIRIDRSYPGSESESTQEHATRRMLQLARAMLQAEQEELLRLRDEEGLPDAITRAKLRDLDVRLQALGSER
jgi:hypothetical protein